MTAPRQVPETPRQAHPLHRIQLQPLADLADVTLDDMELELAKRFV